MDFLLTGHEINLKGANRGFFTTRLRANLERLLEGTGSQVGMRGLGVVVQCADDIAFEVRERLQRALGVQTIVAGKRVAIDLDAITAAALETIAGQNGDSFALRVRRPDKALNFSSHEVAVYAGLRIERELGLRVDLRQPDRSCTIVLTRQNALVSPSPEPGPGGMPAGTAGRLLALVSAGFDSPVAAFRMIRRGGRIVMLHFYSGPILGKGSSLPVVEAVARQLTRYQFHSRLYLCPFDPVQREIVVAAPSSYRILLYRRTMLRVAAALAQRIHAHGLITGDCLAQVASQTARNLEAVNAVTSLPVYRPLIGDDKVSIQAEARQIGTFEVAEEAVDDCCSAYMPPSPALAASPSELDSAERDLDTALLTRQCLEGLVSRRFQLRGDSVELVHESA